MFIMSGKVLYCHISGPSTWAIGWSAGHVGWTLGLLKQPGQCLQENRGTPAQGGKIIQSRRLPPSRTQLHYCSCYLYPWFLAVPSPTLSNPSRFVPVTLA